MFKDGKYRMLIKGKVRSILIRLWLTITIWSTVTVLLILVVCPGPMRAANVNGVGMRLLEFTSEFYMPMGRGRFNGLMAYDGSQYRIAIYWMEPAVYHDNTFFLGYSDFIFSKDVVHYWINGVSQPGSFDLSDSSSDPLLPQDVSVESVARSALAIASRIKSKARNENTRLEIGRFFRQSRDKSEYSYEVPSEQTSNDQKSVSSASDEQILNDLPFGRKYSKETRSDGTMVWRGQRVLDGPHVARVTVKPVLNTEKDDTISTFDPETLGRWLLIPQNYRAYWSFEDEYSKLMDLTDSSTSGLELYDKIESYLGNNKLPDRVYLFLNQLWFKTAILTGDKNSVSRSARAVVTRLCEDVSVSDYQGLLELARIANKIREKYPKQADELIRPLVGQMVKRIGSDASGSLDKLMTTIENNRWFWYGKLLVEEVKKHPIIEEDVTNAFAAKFEAMRLAKELLPYNSCEPTVTVKKYLSQIDADPPAGSLTMDDIRQILKEGLEKPCADVKIDSRDEFVEDVISSIRMIAGEGPFRGDKVRLIESIKRFSWLYIMVDRTKEPINKVLVTFLGLSFCDISTTEDHDVLFSQINELCTEFQTHTNTMLSEHGLSYLVEPNNVEDVFDIYEKKFRRYIDNPLWPAFKFPLTSNEETRLRNKLKLRFSQLEPLLEEMSLKVKYGGVSDELKDKTIYNISLAAQQLLPQTAFLRNPSYPGISIQYRGKYGFTAVIKGPLYKEGERPKEKFKAMKYFHMGHRLEDIVKRERELSGFK